MSPSDPSVTRRLAAILIADVVGYTRLMERDDTGTFSRLRTIRDEVVDPAIVSHGGRIVKTSGDGLLAEFASALSALRAAVQVQREMATRNADVPADVRIEYRIGINLGDVMVDGADLAGDGINVAARLETLSESGGICVSGSVRDQVHGTLDIDFEDIGEQQVKNIARPIRAFNVRLGGAETRDVIPGLRSSTSTKKSSGVPLARNLAGIRLWAASAFVFVATAAFVTSHFQLWPFRQDARSAPPAFSVGVVPVVAQAGDSAAAQRVESLTHDLASSLALAYQIIRVVPVTRSQPGNGSAGGFSDIAKAFNVRYLLEGTAKSERGRPKIRLRLVNGASGEQVWNETVTLPEPLGAHDQLRRGANRHGTPWRSLCSAWRFSALRRRVQLPIHRWTM